MRFFYISLAILFTLLSTAAHSESKWVKLECDFTDSETIYWETLGQYVVLTTRLTMGEEFWPEGRLTLTFSDGTTVPLGTGRKYFDDIDPDNPPSCVDHLEAAKSPTVTTLQQYYPGSGRITDLITESDILDTDFDISAQCIQIDIARDAKSKELGLATSKTHEKKLHGEFLDLDMDYHRCNSRQEIFQNFKGKSEHLRDLIRQNAPLLKVRGSTYFNDIVAYDKGAKSFHKVTAEGC